MKEKMPHRKPKSAKLQKVKTVNDMLTRDDINGMLSELEKQKPNISDLIVIWLDKNDRKFYFQITGDTLVTTAVWMLEGAKLDVMNEDFDEEDS